MKEKIKPFLKWPGRKYNIISVIKQHLLEPTKSNTLVEPFLGSAAIYLNTQYRKYYLCDNNPDLINLYQYLVEDGEKFIKFCSKYFSDNTNKKEKYYELRDRFNNIKQTKEKAALFLYLNRHGYNGLCRYNNSGLYNVPFGSYIKTYFPHHEMQLFKDKSDSVKLTLECRDFTNCLKTLNTKNTNAVVYCDPPYIPISKTSDFTKYSQRDFTLEQQKQLVDSIRELRKNGVSSVISNHDIQEARKLYHDAQIVSFEVKRMISCKLNGRRFVKELLAIYNHQ